MIINRPERLRLRLIKMESVIVRATELSMADQFELCPDVNFETVTADIKRSAVMFLVAAVDDFFKGYFFEIYAGYLQGDIAVKTPVRATVSLATASCFKENEDTNSHFISIEGLGLANLQKELLRDNYQSIASISQKMSELGLPKIKKLIKDPDLYRSFEATIGMLTAARHVIVHKAGSIELFQNSLDDSDTIQLIISSFEEFASSIKNGCSEIVDATITYLWHDS